MAFGYALMKGSVSSLSSYYHYELTIVDPVRLATVPSEEQQYQVSCMSKSRSILLCRRLNPPFLADHVYSGLVA